MKRKNLAPRTSLRALCAATMCLLALPGYAFEAFQVKEIRVEGLQRVAAGTVFNYLPVKVGETFNAEISSNAIQALFKTGLFNDVQLARVDDVLVVKLTERPAIAQISIDGNKNIDTEQLTQAMKAQSFAEGYTFDRSLLDKVEQELQRLYFSQGRYAARIETTVAPLERNRVHIQLSIAEGTVARIRQINLVGNHDVPTSTLLNEFELSPTTMFSFFSSGDQYSRQKLAADLETLRSYYLDRGYINFNIDSTQVSITPDRENIYITINLSEGKQFTVSDIVLKGNLIVPETELRKVLKIKQGELFSGKHMASSREALAERIGDEGYIFATINPIPKFEEGSTHVALEFHIDPGKRIYVRRINFAGNTRSRDEVLRREMRQMEGGWASMRNIKRSRIRLERLGYFENVEVENTPVSGVSDQVDLDFSVVERPSGNLMAGIGYSQTEGFMFNASISQENFLGSGKHVSLAFNNSQVNTIYSLAYTDPYFTIDGLSQGFQVYYKTTDAAEANLSKYVADSYGFKLNYGLPVNEYDSVYIGFEPEHLALKTTEYTPTEIFDYIEKNGDNYNIFKLTSSWSHDTRNRYLFPTDGMLQSFSAELALPGGDLSFYKLSYKHRWYYPLTRHYTLLLKGEMSYGEGYGGTEYPFFENYTAGGPHSVRGYKENTLGPHDSFDNPLGGNLRTVANMELIFPPPFAAGSKSVRMSAFFDAGNVYGIDEDFDSGELRYSAGLGLVWFSPLGGLSFSVAYPLNEKEGDNTQVFQFSIGTTF